MSLKKLVICQKYPPSHSYINSCLNSQKHTELHSILRRTNGFPIKQFELPHSYSVSYSNISVICYQLQNQKEKY